MTNTLRTLLDRPGFELLNDHAALDRVVQVVCLNTGCDYLAGVQAYQDAWQVERQTGPGATVAKVLDRIPGVTLEAVSSDLKLLENRDEQVSRTLEAAIEPLRDEPVDARGIVHLAADADRYALTNDPAERAKRLERARRVAPVYRGSEGERAFVQEDRLHLEAGLDLVRTLERPVELRAAQTEASTLSRQLDQAYATAREPRERVRLLDGEIERLQGEREAAAAQAAVPVDPAAARAKLLEQGESEVRLLSVPVQLRIVELHKGDTTYEQALEQATREAGTGRVYADEVDPLGKQLDDGGTPIPTPPAAESPAEGHREAETLAVHAYMREHGVPFMTALKAVTGADMGVIRD